MSGFDDPEFSKVVDGLFWEYQSIIMTASSVLIAIPLLELSFLAAFGRLTTFQVGLVAIPIIISAILFAVAILALTFDKRQYMGLRIVVALGNWFAKVSEEDLKKAEAYFGDVYRERVNDLAGAVKKWSDEHMKDTRRWSVKTRDWGTGAFIFGIASLVLSFVILAIFLL